MEIMFEDIEEVDYGAVFHRRRFEISLFQLRFGKMLRITKRTGFFRYVLINPSDPTPIIKAFREFRTNLSKESNIDVTGPPPSWLRHYDT
jgi:hypothetical protein